MAAQVAFASPDILMCVTDAMDMRRVMQAAPICAAFRTAAAAALERWRALDVSHTIGNSVLSPDWKQPKFSGPDSVCSFGEELCVADTGNDRFVLLTPAGVVTRVIDLPRSLGHLKFHTGMSGDGTSIYVVDNEGHQLHKMELPRVPGGERAAFFGRGSFVASVGSGGSSASSLTFPEGLALLSIDEPAAATDGATPAAAGSSSSQASTEPAAASSSSAAAAAVSSTLSAVFVADTGNHRVCVFSSSLSPLFQFGQRGNGDGEFVSPCGLATWRGSLYVADSGNHRMQIFTGSGGFVRSFGSRGEAPGQFIDPCGVDLAFGRCYVAEYTGRRVQVLTPTGAPLQVVRMPGQLAGICVFGQQLFVADPTECKLHVLALRRAALATAEDADCLMKPARGGSAQLAR